MLIFHLKKKWFNLIKEGKKAHEYRICNDYWLNRISRALEKHNAKHNNRAVAYFTHRVDVVKSMKVKFCLGYPKKDDKDKILYAEVFSISEIDGINTDLKYNGKVFDIEFELLEGLK